MKVVGQTIIAILIAQFIIYVIGKFTGKTMHEIEVLAAAKVLENESKKQKENFETPEAIKKLRAKILLLLAKRKTAHSVV